MSPPNKIITPTLDLFEGKAPEISSVLDLRFTNDVGAKGGSMDVFTWNIYQLFTHANLKIGLKGESAWRKASKDAQEFSRQLSVLSAVDASGQSAGVTVFQSLSALVRAKKITGMRLGQNWNLDFLGRGGVTLDSVNVLDVARKMIVNTTIQEKNALRDELPALPETSPATDSQAVPVPEIQPGALATPPENHAVIPQIPPFKNFESEKAALFEPLSAPAFSDVRQERSLSAVDALRLTRTAPRIIEDRFRHLNVCSTYAIRIMQQAYGRQALVDAGFASDRGLANAWDLKMIGLKKETVNIVATTDGLLRQSRRKDGAPTLVVKNPAQYVERVGDFFRAADGGNYPAFLTLLNRGTAFGKKVWDANKNRPDHLKSFNSHVVTVLGREETRERWVKSSSSLGDLLQKEAGVSSSFQTYLKVQVRKRNGDLLQISDNGKSVVHIKKDGTESSSAPFNFRSFRLERGDTVVWQDLLITDFQHGAEKVRRFGEVLSAGKFIPVDYIALKDAKSRVHPEYKPVGFFQIDPITKESGSIDVQIKTKLSLTDEDFTYYLTAFADTGIDLRSIRPNDLLPRFDIVELRKIIDAKGGPKALRQSILSQNIQHYIAENPDTILIPIEAGKSPWGHISNFFEQHFSGKNVLTQTDKNFILEAVDSMNSSIHLQVDPLNPKSFRFFAGEHIYLTPDRITRLIRYVQEKHAEQFSPDDYVAFIQQGDTPDVHFKQAILSFFPKFPFDTLDPLEKSYLYKAFQASNAKNPDVDFTLVKDGAISRLARFPLGGRIVFRKADLVACMEDIGKKRVLQKPNEAFRGFEEVKTGKLGVYPMAITIPVEIPPPILGSINELYSGQSLDDVFIRSALPFVYAKEQLGSEGLFTRGDAKDMATELHDAYQDAYGMDISFLKVRSVGVFQLRPTVIDMQNCAQAFETHKIPMPKDLANFTNLVTTDPRAATLVAGERLRESLHQFHAFMRKNGEKTDQTLFDPHFAIQVITSYNRSSEAVFRAVFQNWAYNLASAADIPSLVPLKEIDDKGDLAKRNSMESHVIRTFENVASALLKKGEISFSGNVATELSKMFTNRVGFLNSPLFQEIQRWYKMKHPEGLQFTFSSAELARGNGIFSYGRRYLQEKDVHRWNDTFAGASALRATLDRMHRPYEMKPVEKQQIKAPSLLLAGRGSGESTLGFSDTLVQSGILDCFEGETSKLRVYGKSVSLYQDFGKNSLANIYFGNTLDLVDVSQVNGKYWMKVAVSSGPYTGKEGYVLFDKVAYTNTQGPVLDPKMVARFEKFEKDKKRPLPHDYAPFLQRYLRFLENYNLDESFRSTMLMKESAPTAAEVRDPVSLETIKTAATGLGYKNQKFFAFLPKGKFLNSKTPKLFVIDTENDRVLTFTVGLSKETDVPLGQYAVSTRGFRDLDYMGAPMGADVKRYRGMHIQRFAGAYRSGPEFMSTGSMIVRPAIAPLPSPTEPVPDGSTPPRDLFYFHGTNRENLLGKSLLKRGDFGFSNLDIIYLSNLFDGQKIDFHVFDPGASGPRPLDVAARGL